MVSDPKNIPARFRHSDLDPDDAKDLLEDYNADLDAQYADYVEECAQAGVTPLPRDR